MSNQPSVSTIICTHNRPQLVRVAIDAALAQRYEGDLEVIVVFDRTEPDHSLERDDPHRRVRVISNDHTGGLAGARNAGAERATGELIAFCDDDDAWLPGKIAAQVDALERDGVAQVVTTGILVAIGDKIVPRVPAVEVITFDALLGDRVFAAHPSTVLVRAEFWRALGGIDEEIPGSYGEDYDWMLRATRAGRVIVEPIPLVTVLWGATSMFNDRWQMQVDAFRYLLAKYPEFDTVPAGKARIEGQLAFALSGAGRRDEARRVAWASFRHNPRERRAYLAMVSALGLVPPVRILRALNRFGRGF